MKKPYGYIYKIVCKITGKLYIGQTIGKLSNRLNGHFYDSQKGSTTKIARAFVKYGRDCFAIFPVCRADSRQELNDREIACIRLFNSVKNGYNISDGGYHSIPSEETRKKMSLAGKGKPKPPGHGEKVSKALKGKKHSESHRRNNVQAQINCQAHHDYRHSKESREKISIGNKGKVMPPGFGEGVAQRNRDRGPASEETKKKMSVKRQGRKPALGMIHTEEGKKNISEGLKRSTKMGNKKTIYCENNGKTYIGYRLAAEELGIKQQQISDFFHGKTKTAKGYIFRKL